jgi:type 1 glutamine amidotransferase
MLRLATIALAGLGLSVVAMNAPVAAAAGKAKVLIYSGSTGFRHDSIPAGVAAVKSIATRLGYDFDATEDPEIFTAEKLAAYKAIVFVSTTTDPKKPESEWFVGPKRDALVGFLEAGNGVVGLHAAADSHYHWPWYGQMIGGYFERHPKGTPQALQTFVDSKFPGTEQLPRTITRNDEWYYYKDFNPLMHVLITVDPSTIGEGEADVNPNPVAWYHDFGGGRVFYSGLGHTSESYSEPYVVDLISAGLKYAVGP